MYLTVNNNISNQNTCFKGKFAEWYLQQRTPIITEKKFDTLVKSLPKTKTGRIIKSKLDKADKKAFDCIESFCLYGKKLSGKITDLKMALSNKITNEYQESYNGTSATVIRNLAGHIVYVKTARTEEEAVKSMGLKKAGTYTKIGDWYEGYRYDPEEKGTPLYIAEFTEVVKGKSQPKRDYFIWNPHKRVMELRKLVNS